MIKRYLFLCSFALLLLPRLTKAEHKLLDHIYVDAAVQELPGQTPKSTHTFHLFTHGMPGQLLIEGEWKDASQIASWLQDQGFIEGETHLNVYGCNFGQGETGRKAVQYLEAELGISVAASDDITGIDGDWNLEIGKTTHVLSFPNYPHNLQGFIDCATLLHTTDDYIDVGLFGSVVQNGYTYVAFGYEDFGGSPLLLPTTDGTGPISDRDIYIAIFDPNCNQILGTFYGGNDDDDVSELALDADGNIIIIGYTESTDFPTTDGTVQQGGTSDDQFLMKMAPDGTLIFATVYGGTNTEYVNHMVVDGTDIYTTGSTLSSDWVTTDGSTHSGNNDIFLNHYDGSGNLLLSTLIGGSGNDNPNDIVLVNGGIAIAGNTASSDFPTSDGSLLNGAYDAFLIYLDSSYVTVFSTVYGGSDGTFYRVEEILADDAYLYVGLRSNSSDFPTTDGSVNSNPGYQDVVISKFDFSGNEQYTTTFGGFYSEALYDLEVKDGEVYVLGTTTSSDFPIVNGQPHSGSADVYIVKLGTNGNMIWSTCYGGASSDYAGSLLLNASGEIYTVVDAGPNPPTTDGTTVSGGVVFVKFNTDGSICAATAIPGDIGFFGDPAIKPELSGDTLTILYLPYQVSYTTDGTAANGATYFTSDLAISRFVFCPDATPISSDVLSPSTINVCQNGIVEQIIGEELVIDGSTFPQIYRGGVPENQSDLTLAYQWQYAPSAGGPWTDVAGPLGKTKNYSPPPTSVDVYYQRLTKENECCGGATVSTSNVVSVLVSGDAAPTADAGGTYYTCPSTAVSLGASPPATGGTSPYTYSWYDSTYLVSNPSVSPTQSTVYTLTVTDNNGCKQTDQATVTIYEADAGIDKAVCDGVGTTIGGTPLSGIPVVASGDSPPGGVYSIEYDWSPTTGLSCFDCPNPTATPVSATTYTLTVTLNFPDGTTTCQTNDQVEVSVVAAPTISNFASNDTVICLGEVITLGNAPEKLSTATISSVSQTSGTAVATIANLTDGDFNTGGTTNDGVAENILIDLGTIQNINAIEMGRLGTDYDFKIEVSEDNVSYTDLGLTIDNSSSGDPALSDTELTKYSFSTVSARYVRLTPYHSYRDASISEFYAYYGFKYSWTPSEYITVNNSYADFDAGNLEMPGNNAITYTVTANIETCNFYDQVAVASIEARAGQDACGPREIGQVDRTPNIEETYTWVKITDPGITTGTGNFIGATNQAVTTVSTSTGGDVGYELTTSYTLNGSTGTCKDTVIVLETCGAACDILVSDGGCPDFDEGSTTLTAVPPENGDASDWTYSWTSNLGVAGLDNYDSQTVTLTDNVNRTYTLTMTSVVDPTYTCTPSLEVNSASFSEPSITVTSNVTVCKGDSIDIGDPLNDPGLTYSWTNTQFLSNGSINYPKASPPNNTEFIVTATDNVTGCLTRDTVTVIVPASAYAGPDQVVCDNGIVTIGGNTDTLGFTYTWDPAGADWRNGTDENDAQPDAFVSTTQEFRLTVIDTSGTCTTRDTMNVTVESIPASFSLPDLSFCPSQAGALVLGTDDGTVSGVNQVPGGYSYRWSPGTVSDTEIQNPNVNTPLPTDTVSYVVEVRTAGGCNTSATQTLNPSLSTVLVVSDQIICVGESLSIGDASNPTGGSISYSWSPTTDLDDASSRNPVFTPSAAGTTTFTLTKTDGGPSCSTTADVIITAQEVTAPTIAPSTICEAEAIQIGTTSDASLTYQWSPTTDLSDPYISNPTFTGSSTTKYTLTVANSEGCRAETDVSVTVNTGPTWTIYYADHEFCGNETSSTTLSGTVIASGDYSYSWTSTDYLSDANTANPTLYFDGSASYEYELEVTDQTTGCQVLDTVDVLIQTCGGTIGNVVWLDENGDGVRDAGEAGIPDVTVSLTDADGSRVATTTTDGNGGYLFTDISAGDYTVVISSGLPTSTFATYDENSGTSSPDGSTSVTLSMNEEHMSADFGYNYNSPSITDTPKMTNTGALGDRVWNDSDSDGTQDSGESGIEGVSVTLYNDNNDNGVYDNVVASTSTDEAGNYLFDGISPDAYVVEIDNSSLPSGFLTSPTGDPDGDGDNSTEPIVVAPGDVLLIADFGYPPTAGSSIGNLVFIDSDADGVQDTGESGIEGISIALYDDASNVIASTTTDANGNYSFPGLSSGTYTVLITDTEHILGELEAISDPDDSNDLTSRVTVNGTTDDLTQDFGFAPARHSSGKGLIGNTIYIDTDNNGSLSSGEGVEGVSVEVYASDGSTLLDTTITDETGGYYFGDLNATATYIVKVDHSTLPGGSVYANMDDPDGGAAHESTVDLSAASGVDLDQDFGYEASTAVSISGTIWEDADADGTFDGAESGRISGIEITAVDSDNNIVARSTTAGDGSYSFANLPAGNYTLKVDKREDELVDYWHSLGTDSEASTFLVNASGGSVSGVDVGFYSDGAAIGNYVWDDADQDGLQDGGESGINNVAVSLEIDYDGDNTAEITMMAQTDVNGFYQFGNLLLDEDYLSNGTLRYNLTAATPSGYYVTQTDINTNGNDMEDGDDPTGILASVSKGSRATTTNANPTLESTEASYDFGYTLYPLPLNLVEFTTQVEDCEIRLQWVSSNEVGVEAFEIERSMDGLIFMPLSRVPASGGEHSKTYEYKDQEALNQNFYRLKMIDLDGSATYSKVLEQEKVNCDGFIRLIGYPNPADEFLTIQFSLKSPNKQEKSLKILTALGQMVYQQNIPADKDEGEIEFNVQKWSEGIYYIRLVDADRIGTVKLVIE